MMTTPCQDGDPDSWFIGRDGKQYPSDDFLTDKEEHALSIAVLRIADETAAEHEARIEMALRAARSNRRRAALIRRRKARDACFECPVRTACLGIALEQGIPHGTWGGYYEEQIKEIRDEMHNT